MRRVLLLTVCIVFVMCGRALSETNCVYCDTANEGCFIDQHGVAYCQYVLISYPATLDIPVYRIAPGTTSIGRYSFFGNKYLCHVIVPDGVTAIYRSAFENCENLQTVELPTSLLIIDSHAFASCIALSDISLPHGVYTIGNGAFVYTTQLTEIAFPETLAFIGNEVFAGSGIQDIYFFTTELNYGYGLVSLHHPYDRPQIRLHFPIVLYEDEIGNISSLIMEYQEYVDICYDLNYD